jgi:hypothetical protein
MQSPPVLTTYVCLDVPKFLEQAEDVLSFYYLVFNTILREQGMLPFAISYLCRSIF